MGGRANDQLVQRLATSATDRLCKSLLETGAIHGGKSIVAGEEMFLNEGSRVSLAASCCLESNTAQDHASCVAERVNDFETAAERSECRGLVQVCGRLAGFRVG